MHEQCITREVFKRHTSNPILSAEDVPYESTLVFNAGVTKFNGKYVMVFRNDWGDQRNRIKPRGINLGLATSDDGIKWNVKPKPIFEMRSEEILGAYDPRLTVIDGRVYMCFAIDSIHGTCGGVAVTDDFESFEILHVSVPDNRNMVLFPEKINGNFLRLERPFPMYGRGGQEIFDLWCSDSPDGRYWGSGKLVLGTEDVGFCNSKLGPSAPPVKTDRGWLTLFHAVWKDENKPLLGWEKTPWCKKYVVGVMLLDFREPWKIVGMCPDPIMVPQPEYNYEMDGFRGSVLFPCGMIVEDDRQVKMYYGASDTVIGLATTDLDKLLGLCKPYEKETWELSQLSV